MEHLLVNEVAAEFNGQRKSVLKLIKKTLGPGNPLNTGSRNSENLELPVVGHTITTLTPPSKPSTHFS